MRSNAAADTGNSPASGLTLADMKANIGCSATHSAPIVVAQGVPGKSSLRNRKTNSAVRAPDHHQPDDPR